MAPAPEHVDSFAQFDILYGFLHRPLEQVLEICGRDIFRLKLMLGEHILPLKGEIRKNCQAHSKRKDTEYYLKSIRSKLKEDLLNHLLGQEVNPDYEGTPFYSADGRTPIEKKFVNEIQASFNSMFAYISEIESVAAVPAKQELIPKKEKKKRKIIYPTAYTLDPNVDIESFKRAFEYLKSNNVVSEETTEDQFKACFSGGHVEEKVKWKTAVALKDFIDQLNRKEFIEPIPKRLWTTAVECFTNYYGKTFNSYYLGKTETAGHSRSIKIIEAVSYIKKHVNKKHVN